MAVVGGGTSGGAGINNMASGFSKICRTCASCTDCLMPIFSGEGLLNNLPDKIHRHLPIKVSEWDRLPQQLCRQCASTLLAWHELVKCCSQADAALRTRLQRIQEHSAEEKVATASETNIPSEKVATELKWTGGKIIDFRTYLEGILLNYIDVTRRQADSPDNIIYVCQKCEKYSPFHTIEALADHLEQNHINDIQDEASITHFVTEHLILVETLEESLPEGNLIAKSEATESQLAPVRTRKQSEPTDETLNKLCCPFCQKIFSAPKRLMVHLNVHPEVSLTDGYLCRCCSFSCADVRGFVAHLQEEHVMIDIEGTQQVCRSCGFICDSKPELHEHVKTFHAVEDKISEEKPAKVSSRNPKYIPVECQVCGKIVSNKYNLNAHMKQHTQQTDIYTCTDCGKTYRSRGSLKWHKETVHMGILKYICLQCGEAFPSKMYRDNHMRIHSGETPYQCASCGKSFRSKNSLVVHMKSHLDIRKYECIRCPKKFQKSTHLKYHLKSHDKKDGKRNVKDVGRTSEVSTVAARNPASRPPTQDAQHKCTYCRANFTQRHIYHDHLASVHIDKLFHCDECGQYEDRRNLIVHMSKHAAEYTSGERSQQNVKDKSTEKTQKDDTKQESVSSSTGNGLQGKSTRLKSDTQEQTQVDSGKNKLNGTNTENRADLTNVKTPKEIEEKGSDDKMTLSELKKLKDMKALTNKPDKKTESCDIARGSGNARADSRLAFSDSDSSNGFGELPDSVFEAIEDTRDADESSKGAAKKSDAKGKKRKRVCNICMKEFTVSSSYFYHIKYVHGDNWEHKCETCGRKFASPRTLSDHMSVHTGDRKHACPHCSKLFRSKAGLYIHVKDIHSAAQEKKFVCSQCDKSFRWKQKLILHYRRHKKDKSHVCSECGRGFSARCDLTRHMKTHSQNKPFGCQKCGVHFAQRRYLQNHMAKKHSNLTVSK